MDMLKKLRSSVTNALPVGNAISGDYEIVTHRASAGPGLQWKIYDACNRNTKQEASVFICEKKALEKLSKADRDKIIDTLKRGVSQLTRLRHPNLLSVLHPLEESRDSLAFATEPVFASLANVLGRHENMPVPLPEYIKQFELFDVEIKYGVFQVAEGLAFLHNSVKLVHNNVTPGSVLLNKCGAWKIAGFDFCVRSNVADDKPPQYPVVEWDLDTPPIAQPDLDYLAPEQILSSRCDTASDMFSLGVLFSAIYGKGRPLYECRNELSVFRKHASQLKTMNLGLALSAVPTEVRDYVKLLLNVEPSVRPDADQLSKLSFFEDVGSMTLQYMDSLFQRDNLQKSQFFKGLPKVIEKLPKRVNIQRLLPPLFKESVNKDMVPFILPCILLIADQCTDQEYLQYVLPGLKPIIGMKEPVQILLILLQNMSLLLRKTPPAEIKLYVLPMVYEAVEANSPQVQELCLTILPTFANLIDYAALKNSLIPRIKRLCLSTSLLNVRVNSLLCVGQLLEYMDKWYVLDEIIPILLAIPSREAAVLMSMLGIYKVALTHKKLGMTKEMMATKVLPHLLGLAIDNNLNLQQFNAFMALIRDMLGRVETEQRGKLEQLNSMQTEQKSLPICTMSSAPTASGMASGTDSMMDKVMSGFGMLASKLTTSSTTNLNTQSDVTSHSAIKPAPVQTAAARELPSPTSKGSLSLEEKRRLAQEQELQQTWKSRQSGAPLTATPASSGPTPASSGEPRDLTHTLLDSSPTAGLLTPQKTAPTSNKIQGSLLDDDSEMGDFTSATSGGYQKLAPVVATGNVNQANNPPSRGPTLAGGPGFSSMPMGATQPQIRTSFCQNNSPMMGGNKAMPTNAMSSTGMPRPQGMNWNTSQANTSLAGPAVMTPHSGTFQYGAQTNTMASPMGTMSNASMSMGNPSMQMGNIGMGHMSQQTMGNHIGNMNQFGGMQPNNMGMQFRPPFMGGGMGGPGMLQPNTSNPSANAQSTTKALSSQDIADFLG